MGVLRRGEYIAAMAEETIRTLLDLLNPLHGSLDEQTYDDKCRENFDRPDDYEHHVTITAQQERALTRAVLILESHRAQTCAEENND